jgi:hypothetical protein
MAPHFQNYHSFLLRLWQVQVETGIDWRASLQDVDTGELQGFSGLAALIDYLEKQAFASKVGETDPDLPAA